MGKELTEIKYDAVSTFTDGIAVAIKDFKIDIIDGDIPYLTYHDVNILRWIIDRIIEQGKYIVIDVNWKKVNTLEYNVLKDKLECAVILALFDFILY